MIRARAFFFSLVLGLAMASSSYCEEIIDRSQLKVVEGTISHVNWVRSTITVRWLQHGRTMRYDEISISVPDNLKITKGGNTISLSSLNVFDRVSVTYYDDPKDFGMLRAISIRVLQ